MSTNETRERDLPPYRGVDANPKNRPGVPRETAPRPLAGAHWVTPEQQPVEGPVLVRAGRDRPTPVFSTALPPRGVSGALRRLALGIPDHRVSHVALRLVADRVDVIENLLPIRMTVGAVRLLRRR
jgi:hypothetical protein